MPPVPDDTTPELATGKQLDIANERYTSIFNKTCPTQGVKSIFHILLLSGSVTVSDASH